MKVISKFFGAASLLMTLGAGTATAADFSFNYSPFYVTGGVNVTMVDRPVQFIHVGTVGAFSGSLTGADGYSLLRSTSPLMAGVSFTFCVELTQAVVFGLPTSYTVVDPATTAHAPWGANAAGISSHIDLLMAQALSLINAAPDGDVLRNRLGSLQLAIWEVIYDYSPSMTYSLSSGTLKFAGDTSVLLQSNNWLANTAMSSAAPTAHYAILHESQTQDLLVVTAAPVPEPSSALLMTAALAGLVARRKRFFVS
jgi:PEP-CTERM motif